MRAPLRYPRVAVLPTGWLAQLQLSRLAVLTELHARVEQRIDQICQQVDGDEDNGGQRDDGLKNGKILRRHGPLDEAADAGSPEDGFGNQRAAEQFTDRQRDDGDDGQGRRLQQMLGKQAGGAEPAAARDSRIFLPSFVIEIGDQHFGNLGRNRNTERNGGKERGPGAIGLDHAEKAELEAECMDQEKTDDEIRYRQEERGKAAQQPLTEALRQELCAIGDHDRQNQRHDQPGRGEDQG